MNSFDKFSHVIVSLAEANRVSFLTDEPMALHTSFKIGGPCRMFVTPHDAESLAAVLSASEECSVPSYVLGKGTNVLFDDEGFDGVVVSTLGLDFVSCEKNVIECGAGASFTGISKVALMNSLAGMSFAYGIPGSVGGAVFMNAGAYNGETKDILSSSVYLDLNDKKLHKLEKEEHLFGYRTSSYKEHPERIIISALFELSEGDPDTVKAEMDDFMTRRRTKQPLEFASAGSTFKRYPGRYTGQMIDELGLKGVSVGAAQVSEKHGGFVINRGGATSEDVKKLIALVQEKIYLAYGINIEREVIYVPVR